MKNNFDLTNYMKSNKVGAYQQLNEMWYQDINQALGDFNTMKEVEEREPEYNKEMEEAEMEVKNSNKIEWTSADFSPIAGIKVKKGDKGEIVSHDTDSQYLVKFSDHKFYAQKDKNFKGLEEMGGVKSIGDAGKMATPNSRPNLGRHRSSDMLDKMSKKDHKTNTVVGAKAAAYKAPHMKEAEDDIFAGSDTAKWDNYGNETSEWDTEIAGQTVKGWTAEETQGGAIAWQNPKYPNAHIYATPGWEGVDGIAFELHDSEDGYMDEPKIQKVIGSGTEAWKTKEGYMALMAKAFTVVEKMLIPSEEMVEDDGTGRQINHDFNDDISKDPSEFEDAIQEDADPFSSIKTGIDQITQGDDDDMDMSDDDRFNQLGGDKIKAGIESLMADGFDYREILQFVKDTIASKRNY
jgi:hypothetical protein